MDEPDDLELLQAVLDGREGADDALAVRFEPDVRSSVATALRRYTGRAEPDVVSEVVQETFLLLWQDDLRRLRAYSPEKASLSTYLSVIAYRSAIACLRRSGREEQAGDAVERIPASVTEVRNVTLAQVRAAAAELPPKEKAVFLLRFEQGLSYAEIARLTGMTTGAVGAFISRSRKRLRREGGLDERDPAFL